jgi:tetratricopeptide (TPR) repeat protein
MNSKCSVVIAIIVLTLLYACAPIIYAPKAPLDTPARHVENGIRFLNFGKIEDAFREFNRAKSLDPSYAPAYVGIGFCYGLMGNYEKGLKIMEEAGQLPKP